MVEKAKKAHCYIIIDRNNHISIFNIMNPRNVFITNALDTMPPLSTCGERQAKARYKSRGDTQGYPIAAHL